MFDSVFDWDEANVEHIIRHDLEPEDVEEALLDPRGVTAPAYNKIARNKIEVRKGFIGATEGGRILYVAYTVRSGRPHSKIRVVTARNANPEERRRYKK